MTMTWKLRYFYEGNPGRPDFPVLESGELHIWYFSANGSVLAGQEDVLSAEEREQVQRYKHTGARLCYQTGHTALRLLLGRYLGVPAQALDFTYNEHGKPALALESGIHFNISHSGGWVAVAFARQVSVGVDIECVSDTRSMDSIVRRFFHPQEAQVYGGLSEEQKRIFFYEHWTAREAALKALGIGLTVETNSFLVQSCEDGEGKDYCILNGPAGSERLTLCRLSCPDGYIGCAAGLHPDKMSL